MAQRTIVEYLDDIDGGKADATVNFSLEGVDYEIDLSNEHREELHRAFAPWIGAARRHKGTAKRNRAAAMRRDDLDAIRSWGRENGWKVSDRGRVARELQAAYDAAH